MLKFIPYIFQISLSLAIGLLAFFLYKESEKIGLLLISVAFFLSAVPSIVNLAFLPLRLKEQGYTPVEIGVFSF